MKDELTSKQFYLTPNHPCSYLPGREARTLFLDPRDTVDAASYSALTNVGFRRSGSHLYRPHCDGCKACVPVRVPVQQFRLKRRFRRVLEKNHATSATDMAMGTCIRQPPINFDRSCSAAGVTRRS
jgi:arginine-tRNA-protein transferase